ncbi:3-oxoacyl-[acyl-carrier-protein] reductase FabG [Daldinia childiae]|uniref:3-oxoacyl-[acyl-carrier-protein] reductase FabG n=1 Tax=Daldinia childiae TaxID=326645 RepID=UPI001445B768|nr:3-oxoacyl-[acyl-carrier-protein] reductase FabG [Daldinia childiae]KAF3061481.1 3-oxoacyl-[acyl-carrier-protein] reductase FabG [Daldinia childiae]
MSEFSLPLSKKVAIVTGASRGIGKGIALELARRGATVILTYVSKSSEDLVKEICRTIESFPHKPRTHACRVDLSTLEGPEILISDLLVWSERNLKIDILVNNAGVENANTLAELTVDDYNAVYNLNVRGPLLLTQAVLPYLNSHGRIINIGSVASRGGFKKFCLYGSSKAALEGLTRTWAHELGGNGTTVNCVNPGPVQSDMLDNIPKDLVELQRTQTAVENRIGTVSEVANIVASLAGKDGGWITGQTICASGGYAMY